MLWSYYVQTLVIRFYWTLYLVVKSLNLQWWMTTKNQVVNIDCAQHTTHVHFYPQRCSWSEIDKVFSMDAETGCGLQSTGEKARLLIGTACWFWNPIGWILAAAGRVKTSMMIYKEFSRNKKLIDEFCPNLWVSR